MRHTPTFFAAVLVAFWLMGMSWLGEYPLRIDEIEPMPLEYRLDINTADHAMLQLLPGIGPSIAQNVLEYRSRGEPFRAPDDLQRVRQIGPYTAGRIAPWVRFDAD